MSTPTLQPEVRAHVTTTNEPARSPGPKRRSRPNRLPYALIAPALVVMVLVHVLPAIGGLVISFKKFNLFTFRELFGAPWNGLENYRAILLDSDNCVAEGPGFNVCIVKDGKLASPSRNALPGITRKTVFELADQMGIEATLRDVTSHELYDADELMAVTTAGGVTPINSLDGEAIGNGEPGPMTVAIRDRFWALMDEPSPLIEAIQY